MEEIETNIKQTDFFAYQKNGISLKFDLTGNDAKKTFLQLLSKAVEDVQKSIKE